MYSVAYTNHIGRGEADKKSRGTNIASASDLAAAEKHNNHDYTQEDVDKMQSAIDLNLKQYNKQFDGNLNEVSKLKLVEIVKEIYNQEFSEAVEEYNKTQKRKDRRIEDYYEKISEDKKTDLAVEGLIQIGDADTWKDKSIEERYKMLPLYLDCLREMQKEFPGLRLAGASFHVNESSPHLHWVGVCVHERENAQRGMRKVSSKAAVFTCDNMADILQEKLRNRMEEKLQEVHPDWEFEIKKSGRNADLNKNELKNMELQIENRNLQQAVISLNEEFDKVDEELNERKKEERRKREEIKEQEQKIKEQEKAIGDNNMNLARQSQQYRLNLITLQNQNRQIELLKDEEEYINEAKIAGNILDELEKNVNALCDRKGPFRNKKLEGLFKNAFAGFKDLNDSTERLRKYEYANNISEDERLSEPYVQAKKSLEQQVQEARRRKITEEELAEKLEEYYLQNAEWRARQQSENLADALFKLAITIITKGEYSFVSETEKESIAEAAVKRARNLIMKREEKKQKKDHITI